MNLELLSNRVGFDPDECNPECLPFEESLNKDLMNAKNKTPEELDKEWEEHCQESKEQAQEYLSNIERSIYLDDNDDSDEYSSGDAVPSCNPFE